MQIESITTIEIIVIIIGYRNVHFKNKVTYYLQ